MPSAPAPTPRASLLAGLRTGGVRSTSTTIPHTAAPAGSFNIPRFASHHHTPAFSEDDEEDQLSDMPSQNVFANDPSAVPLTAAVDGPNNRFSHHMGQRGLNPNSVPFSPAAFNPMMVSQNNVQNQAIQLQMLQLEMLRIQVCCAVLCYLHHLSNICTD
jgi:hypothetical protein